MGGVADDNGGEQKNGHDDVAADAFSGRGVCLQLFSGVQLLTENDDWGGSAELARIAASVGAFGFLSGSSKDAALLATLSPGTYTVQVRSANGEGGAALTEIYEVP